MFVARAGVGGELRIIDISAVSELGIKTRPRTGSIAFILKCPLSTPLELSMEGFTLLLSFQIHLGEIHGMSTTSLDGGATHSGALYSTSEYVDLFY